MALGTAFDLLRSGDFSGSFGALFVSQEEVDRSALVAERDLALNERLVAVGRISREEELRRMQNIAANRADTGAIFKQPGTNVAEGFTSGWAEGADRIQSGIRNTVGGVLNWGLGSIPWQVWAGLAVWGLWQTGLLSAGLAFLRRRIVKAA